MAKLQDSDFRFRKNEDIGASEAELDKDFLSDCFIDAGDLSTVRDCTNNKRLILGRVGAGKSALVLQTHKEETRSIILKPEELSLQYLSNSTILNSLTELDVNLDLFYRLLWRHIFAVELIKLRFQLRTEDDKQSFLQTVWERFFGDKKKEMALNYLKDWGESFWKETDYRVKEVTSTFESNLEAKLGPKFKYLQGGITGREVISEEEKAEVVQLAQEVVNGIQIRELAQIIRLLASEFLDDHQQRFFILIDGLDEDWVDQRIRHKLIRALIEAVKDFSTDIKNAKIVVAIRRDLLDRVIRATRDEGFQEEKYESLYLPLSWSGDQLIEILDRRIRLLIRRQYTRQVVKYSDVLPDAVDEESIEAYLINRTLRRPRDIIMFFNEFIRLADGQPLISRRIIKDAEPFYSQGRFRSLGDEWYSEYPELLDIAMLLRGKRVSGKLDTVTEEEIIEKSIEIIGNDYRDRGVISESIKAVTDTTITTDEFRCRVFSIFYLTGIVGLKPDPTKPLVWSYRDGPIIRARDITASASYKISPAFYRVLSVDERT